MRKLVFGLALLLALAIPMAAQAASPAPGNHHWRGVSAMGGHWDGAGSGVYVTYQWTNPNAMNAYGVTPSARIHPAESCPPPAGCYIYNTSQVLTGLTCYSNHTYTVRWQDRWSQYGYMTMTDDEWDSSGHIYNTTFTGPGNYFWNQSALGSTYRWPAYSDFYTPYGQVSGRITLYNGGCPA